MPQASYLIRRRPLYPRRLTGAQRQAGGHHSRGRRRSRGRPRGRDHPAGWRPHARRAASCAQDRRRQGRAGADRIRKRGADSSGGDAAGRCARNVHVALPGPASVDLAVEHLARAEPALARLRGPALLHQHPAVMAHHLVGLSRGRRYPGRGFGTPDHTVWFRRLRSDRFRTECEWSLPCGAGRPRSGSELGRSHLRGEARAQAALDGSHRCRSRPAIPRHCRRHRPSRDVDVGDVPAIPQHARRIALRFRPGIARLHAIGRNRHQRIVSRLRLHRRRRLYRRDPGRRLGRPRGHAGGGQRKTGCARRPI